MLSDIRPLEVEITFTEEPFRTPLMFGTGVIRTITSMTARVRVETKRGDVADGWGNILLSDLWGFPSAVLSHEERDRAMRKVAHAFGERVQGYGAHAHPVDLYMDLKGELKEIAERVDEEESLVEPMPILGALVCASPVDAALHDAFGNVNGMDVYEGYGPEHMVRDLSTYLGDRYRGKYIGHYLRKTYVPSLPIFHLVGGMDKLRRDEVDETDPEDGLPVSLEEWIEQDGLFCFKIKLKGNAFDWDVTRMRAITEVARDSRQRMGEGRFYFSIDTNEQCEDPEYVVDLLEKLRADEPDAFEALLYVEQPTERNLAEHRFDMRKLAAIKPVLADEGITDVTHLDLARELGWSGVALKTCKGHSSALLYVARSEEEGMPYTVQDLTNPGLSLVHSAGLAARIRPLMGVEYNSRQYIPQADPEVQGRHQGIFTVTDGRISTGSIQGAGLGYGMPTR